LSNYSCTVGQRRRAPSRRSPATIRNDNVSLNSTAATRILRRLPALRSFIVLALTAGLTLLAAGAAADHRPPLRFGSNLWIGYEPFYLARQQGLYAAHEAHALRLIQLSSASDVLHAFRSDRLEVAAITLDEALRLANEGTPFKAVLLIDISNGADALLGGPGLSRLAELNGKRIGVEDGATGAILLHHALNKAGLKPDQLRIVPLKFDRHQQALQEGQVDALVTFDPVRSQLLASGAHLLFDSSEAASSIVDLLIVRPEVLKSAEQRAALTVLIRGYFSMLAQLHGGNANLIAQAATNLELTPDQLQQAMHLIEQPDRARNCALLCGTAPPFEATVRQVSDIMAARNLLRRTGQFDLPIDDQFIRVDPP